MKISLYVASPTALNWTLHKSINNSEQNYTSLIIILCNFHLLLLRLKKCLFVFPFLLKVDQYRTNFFHIFICWEKNLEDVSFLELWHRFLDKKKYLCKCNLGSWQWIVFIDVDESPDNGSSDWHVERERDSQMLKWR